MPRSFEIDAAIASSRSFAHGRQEPVARPYPARLRPSPSDERWAPGAGRLSRRSLATSAAGEGLCRRLCSSFLRAWSHRTPPAGHYVTGVAMPRAADGESSRYAPMRAASRRTGPTGAPPWTVCSRPRRRRARRRRRRRRRMRTDSARQTTATTLDAPRQRPQGPLCLRWWRRGGGSTLQQEDIINSFTAAAV